MKTIGFKIPTPPRKQKIERVFEDEINIDVVCHNISLLDFEIKSSHMAIAPHY